ncbi:hypothetical protein M409DRAFT_17165 [Zasmidium cellare ATCC 36951]|uniref:Ankyrin repeat protein n=1 Tax=Zasmidium cellare ATCC 36951 TaxID=1080233 RepID=A0A6A6D510_ZASCE|nr:uncharacterized protein M409DRAFT_17165 [Zasmidium cellare ATCC 36951]KAF2173219.1 hypothetical protein M409DRAFT_17165 [Zasmidium cellare ATCC 36951]
MAQAPTIDRVLNLAADSPDDVLTHLQSHPELASKTDAHGYNLVAAAASYGHDRLLKALINDYKVDPNIKDEDGETALFNVEEVRMAKELIELGTDLSLPNNEGQTAAEKLDDEDEQPAIAAFLREIAAGASAGGASTWTETAVENASPTFTEHRPTTSTDANGTHPPPPLPNGLQLNVGTMSPGEAGDEPDPEFRRRIEELASHPDFQGEEGQRELRRLIQDAISGVTGESQAPASSRRRVD